MKKHFQQTLNQTDVPVCIADLPAYSYQVDFQTPTETVVDLFENNPDLPGILIVDNNQARGIITRLKLFERLGHRYGVELFMRKSVLELMRYLRTEMTILSGHLRVDEAVQLALSRRGEDAYDAIVVEIENQQYQVLDVNLLLLVQSQTVAGLSNIVGKLEMIDKMISHLYPREKLFEKILKLMQQTIPYHSAAIILQNPNNIEIITVESRRLVVVQEEIDAIVSHPIFQLMLHHQQDIFIPDTRAVPSWDARPGIGNPITWLGIPLVKSQNTMGLISIGRNTRTPFQNGEKDTARAFAQRIISVIHLPEKSQTEPWSETVEIPSCLQPAKLLHPATKPVRREPLAIWPQAGKVIPV